MGPISNVTAVLLSLARVASAAWLPHLPLRRARLREGLGALQRVLGPPQRVGEHLRELPVVIYRHVAAVLDDALEELDGQRRVLADLVGHLVRGGLERGAVVVDALDQ